MGTPMGIGTGMFKLLQNTAKKEVAERIEQKSLIKLEPTAAPPQPTTSTTQQLLAPSEMGIMATRKRTRQSSTSTAISNNNKY
jgi:hypothetical protein